MIISVQLKHYKVYKNINFIPITTKSKFSAFVGQNGIGKTSILCALDKFFNHDNFNSWNINASAKKDGLGELNKPFIVPTFFIKKNDISGKINQPIAAALDQYFRETTYTVNATSKEFSKFYLHRDDFLSNFNNEDYYFFSIGKKYSDKNANFGLFESDPHLNEIIETFGKDKLFSFLEYVIGLYTFLYLPVEIDLVEFTKLEQKNMQILTNGEIEKTIAKSISQVDFSSINNILDSFLKHLTSDLKEYEYKRKGVRTKIKDSDLIEKIIEIYFSTKSLHKSVNTQSIPIENLSSGEKRKAFIDILLSFFLKESIKNDKIIIAIDEPEASLHISNCYLQFKKIFDLVDKNHQVLITSHWYGFLPTLPHGCAINILKTNGIYNFNPIDLNHNRSQITQDLRRKNSIPYDISIKSFNDLVQSILFSLQDSSKFNWIICEGISEKIYFEYYFENEIKDKNLKILPAGGNKIVNKIYNYLVLPLKEIESLDRNSICGKLLFLIDTDSELIKTEPDHNLKNMFFNRLLQNNDNVILEKVDSNIISPPTEIEDCLHNETFYETLIFFAANNQKLKKLIEENDFNSNSKTSKFTFDLKRSDIELIKNFFDDNNGENKILFAKKYVEIAKKNTPHTLQWIENIKNIF